MSAPGTPGGSGAVLGMRVVRYSGVQGVSLLISNVLQMALVVAVANFLGPAELARFSLLIFLGGIATLIFGLVSKPGTIRRVFGAADDDDDDDEDDSDLVSSSPKRSLGVGLAWATILGFVVVGLVIALREPLAELILGDGGEADLVIWAGVLGGAGVVFKLASITLWLERRPTAFVIGDASRGVIGLVAIIVLLAGGGGLEGAITGAALGSVGAALLCGALLLGSFEPAFNWREVGEIVDKGKDRAPVVVSFWLVQNGDVFVLSKFVSLTELGIYTLASRLGFMVSFLPQAFRVSMRPLRKSAAFAAVRDQYGNAIAKGQLLGYFLLICIVGVLAMVFAAGAVVDVAPAAYAGAASLVPLAAAGFVMAPVFRTMNGQTSWIGRSRKVFAIGAAFACVTFIGVTSALAPLIGAYAAPVGMIVGFGIPSLYLFIRGQRNERPIAFPYREVGIAVGLAVVFGAARLLLPPLGLAADIAVAVVGMLAYLTLLVALRVVPEHHRAPLVQMMRSSVSGRPDPFRPKQGIQELDASERARLRAALLHRIPADELAAPPMGRDPSRGPDEQPDPAKFNEAVRIMRMLRVVACAGGVQMVSRHRRDDKIAELVFVDEPTAIRNATLRELLDDNHDAADLRAVEDVAARLRGLGDRFWSDPEAPEEPGEPAPATGSGSRTPSA